MKIFIPQRLHDGSLRKLKTHYHYLMLKRLKKLEIRAFSTLYGMTNEQAESTMEAGRSGYCLWDVEEGNPRRSLFFKDWRNICGPVRDQRSHINCWTYPVTDCFSARRLLTGEDKVFRIFSTKYLTYYATIRELHFDKRGVAHMCPGYNHQSGFRFIQHPRRGVPEQDPQDLVRDFNCVNDAPPKNPPIMYNLEEGVETRVSDKLEDLYEMLERQPVAANLLFFSPEMATVGKGIYEGPSSPNTVYLSKHGVVITAIRRIGGKLVAIVKNSHGLGSGDNGYFKVLLTRMVYGMEIKKPTLLLSGFTCPMLPPKAESKSKSESDDAIDVSHESESSQNKRKRTDDASHESENKRKRTDSHESESHQKKRASGRESESHQKKRASESASKPPASKKAKTTAGREDSVLLDHTETKPCQKLKEISSSATY